MSTTSNVDLGYEATVTNCVIAFHSCDPVCLRCGKTFQPKDFSHSQENLLFHTSSLCPSKGGIIYQWNCLRGNSQFKLRVHGDVVGDGFMSCNSCQSWKRVPPDFDLNQAEKTWASWRLVHAYCPSLFNTLNRMIDQSMEKLREIEGNLLSLKTLIATDGAAK